MTLKLEVGKSYRQRDGEKSTVTSYSAHHLYPFHGRDCMGEFNAWTIDGFTHITKAENCYDLIAEWTEPAKDEPEIPDGWERVTDEIVLEGDMWCSDGKFIDCKYRYGNAYLFRIRKIQELAQLDTSTPEGFKQVIMHCHKHGFDDLQCLKKTWRDAMFDTLKHLMDMINKGCVYRIKPPAPARVPKVGDVCTLLRNIIGRDLERNRKFGMYQDQIDDLWKIIDILEGIEK